MPSIGAIPSILKTARQRKGLSQRALAEKVGVPQSHISKIESGGVDLQTSSLIAMARAIDLEVQLVPRRLLPAVQAMEREGALQMPVASTTALHKNLDRLLDQAKGLEKAGGKSRSLEHFMAAIRDARKLPVDVSDVVQLQNFSDRASVKLKNMEDGKLPTHFVASTLQNLSTSLRRLSIVIAHKVLDRPSAQVPAYRIEEDDDA
jgi:transcriptional regulator with XRE-family HTH domain